MTKIEANIPFPAHCDTCDKTVSVLPLLNKGDLLIALRSKADVRVHVTTAGDHIWSLNSEDRRTLNGAMAKDDLV